MGVSTDAVLFYGYCWDDEIDIFHGLEDSHDSDWAKVILRRRGVVDPWDKYVEPARSMPYQDQRAYADRWCEEHRAELDAWHDAQRDVEKEFGVEVDFHCSGNASMPYIHATGGALLARRGYPEEVSGLLVDPTWDAKLDRFMAEFGIEKPHDKPRWWLVSYWG
jgi:hypothetical protein